MKKIGGITRARTREDNFHARVQALRSRNARQDKDCLEVLMLLALLAVLFTIAF
uniref:Uncharacterized protein n=1 Tax=Siphoviridae sp. cthSp75 TaxID=2826424 RepID=A0A8S5NF69_9CAUD|nr:MAG TPA: hypothetical protein [Siphoviridae sp. cthSp75]